MIRPQHTRDGRRTTPALARRRQQAVTAGSDQRGFALAFALLMIMILTLLGASLLLMARTENRIAENERLSAQALYAAESGTRIVKRWFDRPGSAANLINPDPTVVDRSLRLIDADGDPATSPVAADGSPGSPRYKQAVDRNLDGLDDLFEKPYRGSLVDALLGTEAGPDMRIDETASAAARSFLVALSDDLFADYPGRAGNLRARVTSIDLYAPPYVLSGGSWQRFGIGTAKVIARIYHTEPDGSEFVLAERMVKVVLNEIPYNPGELGPLHSCDRLTWNGEFTVHWGLATAVSITDLHNNHDKQAVSLGRVLPPSRGIDLIWGYDDDATFAAHKNVIDGLRVEDPWFRMIFGDALLDAPNALLQPWPFSWTVGNPLSDGELPYHPGPPGPNPYPTSWDGTHSNVFQHIVDVGCPEFPYELWKSIAQSGTSDVHYYVWDSGTSYRENGVGPARTFREITDQQTGLFFFDTVDGVAPHDDNGDGVFDNLTPRIRVQGGRWGVRGMIYLNTVEFATQGITGRDVTFNAPGEPYQDKNLNGRWDTGEDWINLDYPTRLRDPFVADAADRTQNDGSIGANPVRNHRGPDMVDEALVWGILFNNGYYDATGNGVYYGSLISVQGIGWFSPSAGTPDHYWDESLRDWPPASWDLPRVAITRWETDI
jgi:hypothetical protein